MELYQLKTFVTVAQEGHLTRASERLFASQPTVSAHIKALEEELGLPLFTRSRKGMHLTGEGKQLLPLAERILASTSDFKDMASALSGKIAGYARLGLNSTPTLLRITELFGAIRRDFPRLELHLVQSLSSQVLTKVKNGDFDAGFVMLPCTSNELCQLPLAQVNIVVTGPAEWKEKLAASDLKSLADFPWIWGTSFGPHHRLRNELFCDKWLKNTQSLIAEDDNTKKSLIISGAGLGLLEETEARESEAKGEVYIWDKEKITVDLAFVYKKKRQNDPVIQALLSCLQKIWKTDEEQEK